MSGDRSRGTSPEAVGRTAERLECVRYEWDRCCSSFDDWKRLSGQAHADSPVLFKCTGLLVFCNMCMFPWSMTTYLRNYPQRLFGINMTIWQLSDTICISTNKMHKILVIRLYFPLDALHVLAYISPSSGATFISYTSLLVCTGVYQMRCTAYKSCSWRWTNIARNM